MNSGFFAALGVVVGAFNSAWDLFFSSWPAIAVTMLLALLIISIVIDRLINPMIGKATGDLIDRTLFATRRAKANKARERKLEAFMRRKNANDNRSNKDFIGPHQL